MPNLPIQGPVLRAPGPVLRAPGPVLRGLGPVLRGLGPVLRGPESEGPEPGRPPGGQNPGFSKNVPGASGELRGLPLSPPVPLVGPLGPQRAKSRPSVSRAPRAPLLTPTLGPGPCPVSVPALSPYLPSLRSCPLSVAALSPSPPPSPPPGLSKSAARALRIRPCREFWRVRRRGCLELDAARPEGAAARLEKAAGRPEPPRRPGGRREAKIRGVQKMLPEPLGGSGAPPESPGAPGGALGAPKGPKMPPGGAWGPWGPMGPCGALGALLGPLREAPFAQGAQGGPQQAPQRDLHNKCKLRFVQFRSAM